MVLLFCIFHDQVATAAGLNTTTEYCHIVWLSYNCYRCHFPKGRNFLRFFAKSPHPNHHPYHHHPHLIILTITISIIILTIIILVINILTISILTIIIFTISITIAILTISIIILTSSS